MDLIDATTVLAELFENACLTLRITRNMIHYGIIAHTLLCAVVAAAESFVAPNALP